MIQQIGRLRRRGRVIPAALEWSLATVFALLGGSSGERSLAVEVRVASPNGRNAIVLQVDDDRVAYSVERDGRLLFGPSPLGPELAGRPPLAQGAEVAEVRRREVDEEFALPWGKTSKVRDHASLAAIELEGKSGLRWQVDLRAYDDGVAFRYQLPSQADLLEVEVRKEITEFAPVGEPTALFNTLASFTTSHESLYSRSPVQEIPIGELIDCPILFVWPGDVAAAITEAKVLRFAGMYLERPRGESVILRSRLSPSHTPGAESVVRATPCASPWRVVLLRDAAGELLESNLLLCLNDAPTSDFSWAVPGKTTFHWWNGEFEEDYRLVNEREEYIAKHCAYIDFCAENGIAYHGLSGDGFAWYQQSRTGYGTALDDADLLSPRPEIGLHEILAYAQERGVGVRLWVHWKPLSQQLEPAMAAFEAWGVKGLMVDFLDRDDQEMIEFTERMLACAAEHHVHIQIHGSSKNSGEQRTYPNLFNREGVLNLEYSKWGDVCSPAHNVNVAYTRALTGPVDYHSGGLRCAPRQGFQPQSRDPLVLGTRCHQMALFVVYENPMPMVADAPANYKDQVGFEFLREVPTTWDETRFLQGEPGDWIVLARRRGDAWYLGGMTNWTRRELQLPLDFLGEGEFVMTSWVDGSLDEAFPNEIRKASQNVSGATRLTISLAPGGGFVAAIKPGGRL